MEQAARVAVAKHRKRTFKEKQAMRALILTAAVLGLLANANAAQAGLSSTPREVASADTASLPETNRPDHVRTGGHAHHPRRVGGPIGAIGSAIGGLFR
jgi:hypothetical protein